MRILKTGFFPAALVGLALTAPFNVVSAANFQQVLGIEFASSNGSYPNYVIVTLDGAIGDQPGCTGVNYRVSFDATTSRGKNLLSMFQSAWLSGRRAKVTADGYCAVGVASLKWVNFN
jgi:hypothetical protein